MTSLASVSAFYRQGYAWMMNYPWYVYWALCSSVLVSVHWDAVYYRHDGPKWWVLDVAFSIYVFFRMIVSRQIKLRAIGLCAVFFVVWSAITTLWASNFWVAIEMSTRVAVLLLALYFLTQDVRGRYPHLLSVVCFFSASIFFVVLAVERYILQIPYGSADFTPLGFINHAGHVFIIWIPVFFVGVLLFQGVLRYCAAVLLLATLWILIDSAIRGSLAGLMMALVLGIVVSMAWWKNYRLALRMGALLILVFGGILLFSVVQNKDSYLNTKLQRTVQFSDANTVSTDRIVMYLNTLSMSWDNPFGVGMNNFEYIHPKYAQVGTANASPLVNEQQILRTPHNFYLKMLSELGFVGGGLLLLLLGGVMWQVFQRLKQPAGNLLWASSAIGVSAVLANGLFDAALSNPASQGMFIVALAALLGGGAGERSARQWQLKVTSAWLLLPLGLLAISSASLVSQHLAGLGQQHRDAVLLQKALAVYPGNERGFFDLALVKFEQEEDVAGAEMAMERFLDLYPYHIGARFQLSRWQERRGNYLGCKINLEKVLRIYPSFK